MYGNAMEDGHAMEVMGVLIAAQQTSPYIVAFGGTVRVDGEEGGPEISWGNGWGIAVYMWARMCTV